MPFLAVRDDLDLFYTDEGHDGPPLLFVHGWTCDSHDWSAQLEYFTPRRRVIAVDLRGHGASSVAPDGYEPRVFAEDVVLLLRALGVSRVVAVGHSLGALVVSALAVEHPDLVDGVVVIEPSYGYGPQDAAPMVAMAEAMTPENAIEMTTALIPRADGTNTPDFFRSWHRRRVLAQPPHVVAETYVRNWTGPDEFGTRARTDAHLDRRACPSLTVYSAGHEDCAAWARGRARAGLDESLYLPLSHWPHHEMPGLFNALIENWTDRLPGRAA